MGLPGLVAGVWLPTSTITVWVDPVWASLRGKGKDLDRRWNDILESNDRLVPEDGDASDSKTESCAVSGRIEREEKANHENADIFRRRCGVGSTWKGVHRAQMAGVSVKVLWTV